MNTIKHPLLSIPSFTALALLSIIAFILIGPTSSTFAVSGSDFDAGHIIDDAVFYDKNAMSASQIQKFLDAKRPTCDVNGEKNHSYYYNTSTGRVNDSRDTWVTTTRAKYGERVYNWTGLDGRAPYTCLKNYSQSTPQQEAASGLCESIPSRSSRSSALIIDDVAKACGVNPQVLIVLLQKEQSLVTDDWPWPGQYEKATGFACPDTADCDPKYKGFFYQVYSAALQYNIYRANPGDYNYEAGRDNNIYWHPDLSRCGSSTVHIRNQATAGLYIYTPYRPNKASLDSYPGTGDSCSSYGNRNFWFKFNDWFGTPTPSKDIIIMTSPTTSKIYLISGDKKVHIANPTVYKAWGLDKIPVTQVEDSVLNSYRESTYPLRRLAKSQQSGVVYLVDDQKGYSFPNQNRADVWGTDISKRPTIDNLPIKNLVDRRKLPVIVNSSVGSEKYLMDGGTLRHFPSFAVINAWEKNGSSVTFSEGYYCKNGTSGDSCDPRWPIGDRLWSSEVKGPKGDTYLIDRNIKHPVAGDLEGALLNEPEAVSQATLDRKSTRADAQAVIKINDSPHIYLANGKKLHRFASPGDLKRWKPNKHAKTLSISPDLGKLFNISETLNGFTADDGTKTYYVNAGKYNLDAKLATAFTSAGTAVSLSAETLGLYNNQNPSPFVTSSDTNKIFFVNAGGTKHHIATIGEYRLFKNNTNLPTLSLPPSLLNAIENGARARYQFASGENNYVLDNGSYHKVLSSEWGLNPSFTVDAASLAWFEQKADLNSHFKNGGRYGIVRDGTIYTSNNKALGSLWGTSDSSPAISNNLMGMFKQKTMSPFVGSSSSSNPRIYVYDGASLFHIPTVSAWKNLGVNRFNGRVTLSESQITALANGRSTYILNTDDGLVEDGVQRNFTTTGVANAWVTAGNQKYGQKLVDLYSQESADPVGALITSSETNRWYCIENGEKRWVTSFSALNNSSCSDQSVERVSHDLLKQIPVGDNIN